MKRVLPQNLLHQVSFIKKLSFLLLFGVSSSLLAQQVNEISMEWNDATILNELEKYELTIPLQQALSEVKEHNINKRELLGYIEFINQGGSLAKQKMGMYPDFPPEIPVAPMGPCVNMDFEHSTKYFGWETYRGCHPNYITGACNNNPWTDGGSAVGPGCCPKKDNLPHASSHRRTTGGWDKWGLFDELFQDGGQYSAILGDEQFGSRAQRIQQTFTVDSTNYVFSFHYAVVLEQPNHLVEENPYFEAIMFDDNGDTIPCAFFFVTAGGNIEGFDTSALAGPGGDEVVFKPWTTHFVDLLPYMGEDVTIRFTSSDCAWGGHMGYAYVEASCGLMPDPTAVGNLCSNGTGSITLTAPDGAISYVWTGPGGFVDSNQTTVVTDTGLYNIEMNTGLAGCDRNVTYRVDYSDPVPAFSLGGAGNLCPGDQVTFSDNSTPPGGIIGWEWDFGDGTISNNQNPTHTFDTAGIYNVSLKVQIAGGCDSTIVVPVEVNPEPSGTFVANSVCPDSAMTFNSSSVIASGNVSSWDWDFGDGSSSTQEDPTHVYTVSDTFSVSLIFTSDKGCVDTVLQDVIVNPEPVAALSGIGGCDGGAVTFSNGSSGNIISWEWDFGDGTTSTQQNPPPHSFPSNGSFNVTLKVTSDSGCVDIASTTVTLAALPIANFLADSVCVTNTTNFTDSSYIPTGGNVSGWEWDFGDGSAASSSQNPTHTYADSGTYTVTLIVATANNCLDTIVKDIIVYPAAIPDFIADTVCVGDTTDFTGWATGGNVTGWGYDFDDGNTSNQQSPSHVYNSDGTYNVDLVITTDNGCVTNQTHDVIVYPNPEADFGTFNICPGELGSFTDASTGSPISWDWDFGDGTTSTSQNPTHTYPTEGTYNVSLRVVSAFGCEDDTILPVIVNPPPVADFGFNTVCEGDAMGFSDNSQSSDPITTWDWDFGDGSSHATGSAPGHTYAICGTYDVTLIAATGSGCPDTITKTVTVEPRPVADFASPDTCEDFATAFTDNSSIGCNGTIQTYEWDFGDGTTSNLQNPTHQYGTPGFHSATLTVTGANGCKDVAVKNNVRVNGVDVDMTGDGNYGEIDYDVNFVSSINYGTAVSYEWDFDGDGVTDDTSPIYASHRYEEIGKFTARLIVTDINGCMDTAYFDLETYLDSRLTFPNVFTPGNNDGKNDVFKPIDYKGITEIEGIIYNRWGSVIYTWDNIGEFWFGYTNAGKMCPAGTYFYIINAMGADGVKYDYHGYVTLLRDND